MSTAPLQPIPPFNPTTARQKVRMAQDKWNTRTPELVAPAYTPDSIWRNRDDFFVGTAAIEAFLRRKWEKERNYRLRKELFAFDGDRMCAGSQSVHLIQWV